VDLEETTQKSFDSRQGALKLSNSAGKTSKTGQKHQKISTKSSLKKVVEVREERVLEK